MDKGLFLAIPTYTGQIHAETTRCVMEAMLDAIERRWRFEYRPYPGCPIISRLRNTIVSDFLASDMTDLLFVDADVVWQPGAVGKLVGYPVDVVAGIYPHRTDPLSWPVRYLKDRPDLWADPDTGLLEVDGVPGGFLRLTRVALEKMIAAYPELRYNDFGAISGSAHALFDHALRDKEYYGEDYVFCDRWHDVGGKVWVDPNIAMRHIGYKTFSGTFGTWLKGREPIPVPTNAEAA